MTTKLIGAVIIISGCGGFGILLTINYKRQEQLLNHMIKALEIMGNELRFRLTPLPYLCVIVSKSVSNPLKTFFLDLSYELNKRKEPDVLSCIRCVLAKSKIPEGKTREILVELGGTLGMYDLEGQEKGLQRIQKMCIMEADEYRLHYKDRTRCYKTLGICTGAAISILFL